MGEGLRHGREYCRSVGHRRDVPPDFNAYSRLWFESSENNEGIEVHFYFEILIIIFNVVV